MGKRDRLKVSHRTPRTQENAGIGCTLAFALPFVGAGTLAMLRAAGVITGGEVNGPLWILWLVGGLFATVGLWILLAGLLAVQRARRRERLLREHRHEPWLADHPWNARGIHDSGVRSLLHGLVGLVVMGVLLAVTNWFAWFADGGDAPIFVKAICVFFDLILLLLVWAVVMQIFRQIKYERSWLAFERFPFHPGETLDVTLHPPSNLREFNEVSIRLQCIQEQIERQRRGGKSRRKTVYLPVASEEVTLAGPGRFNPGGAGLRLPIAIPEDAPGTALSLTPARYWELTVEADTPGVDYEATFLVPIYEKPGANP